MSETPFSYDAYATPVAPDLNAPKPPMPGALKAIGIIAIILGGIGTPSALLGLLGAVVGQRMQQMFQLPAGAGADPSMQMQQEMQDRFGAISRRYLPVTLITECTRLLVALTLLIGGIMVLGLKPLGRSWLLAGCLVGVLYEIGSTIVRTIIQLESVQVMREMAGGLLGGAGVGGGPSPETFSQIMTGVMVAGIVFTGALALAKIVFYFVTILYLRKPAIVSQFQS